MVQSSGYGFSLKKFCLLFLGFFLVMAKAMAQDARLLSEIQPAQPEVLILVADGATAYGSCGKRVSPCPQNAYDMQESRGGVEEVAQSFRDIGHSVLIRYYSDYWFGHVSPLSQKQELGFEELLRDLDWVKEYWVEGQPHPTRLMLAAGSEGSIWTHLAAQIQKNLVFDYLADLDDLCGGWKNLYDLFLEEEKNGRDTAYLREKLGPWLTPRLCDPMTVPGSRHFPPYHFTDIVPENVRFNLEVHTKVFAPEPAFGSELLEAAFTDFVPNVRPDGSRPGIYSTIEPTAGHGALTYPGTYTLQWLSATITTLENNPSF